MQAVDAVQSLIQGGKRIAQIQRGLELSLERIGVKIESWIVLNLHGLRLRLSVYCDCYFVCAWQNSRPIDAIKRKLFFLTFSRRWRQKVELLWRVVAQVPGHTIKAVV